jgi:hypothetical protein
MNEELEKPYSTQEVEKALFMMGASKAPGPDGFTMGFYQTHWEMVGPSVTNAVLNFFKWWIYAGCFEPNNDCVNSKIKAPAGAKKLQADLSL